MKVTVRFEQTINLGNYESVRPAFELTDEAQPGEDLHDAYFRIRADAEVLFIKEVHAQIALHRELAAQRQAA